MRRAAGSTARLKATDTTAVAGGRTGIPFGVNGNLLLRRKDLLEPAGFTEAPKTWEELVAQAVAVNAPPVFGPWPCALQRRRRQRSGQRCCSPTAAHRRRCRQEGHHQVRSDPRPISTWLKDAWDKASFPPGNTTWDGAGDNQAYLGGPGRLHRQHRLGRHRRQEGRSGTIRGQRLLARSRAARKASSRRSTPQSARHHQNRAPCRTKQRRLLEHLSNPEFMNAYFNVAIYGPVLKSQEQPRTPSTAPTRSSTGLLGLAKNGTPPAYPDVYNAAYADFSSQLHHPQDGQRVVVDGWDFDKAMDEAQTQGQAIYDKY